MECIAVQFVHPEAEQGVESQLGTPFLTMNYPSLQAMR